MLTQHAGRLALLSFGASLALAAGSPAQPPRPQPPGGPPPKNADPHAGGNNPALQVIKSIKWQKGPTTAAVGDVAKIQVPAGYQYTDAAGARVWADLNGNRANPNLLGVLMPAFDVDKGEEPNWFVNFTFEAVGYVKDDEKDKIDADALLESFRQGAIQANKERAARGMPALNVVGWEKPPAYDARTNRLTWAIKGESQGQFVVNFNSRLLGREGVMSANLVCGTDVLQSTLPTYEKLLTGYSYNPGKTYAEYKPGDKIAEYGLTALVAGGALAVAAKSGLLGKLLKPLIVVGVLIVGAIGSLFKKVTGRGS